MLQTIAIVEARALQVLRKLGFSANEAALIARNLMAAELVEKRTHGLVRLQSMAKLVAAGSLSTQPQELIWHKKLPTAWSLDGRFRPGFCALYQSLEQAIPQAQQVGLLAVTVQNMEYASGYIGDYARLAAEANLIFLGFHNSPGHLVPFGTTKGIWGTNPLTIGVPTHSEPVILDMASSQITFGELLVARSLGKQLPAGVALDAVGQPTIEPDVAIKGGGLVPFAGHKGSALAFLVELLAGGLSHSRVGGQVEGGWGSFYLLINPSIFRDLKEFKDEVQAAIDELHTAPKAVGFSEVFFPGEQAARKRQYNLERGAIEVDEGLWKSLEEMVR